MPSKTKICHFTTVHPPFDGRIFHMQAMSLAEAGFDVTLIARSESSAPVSGVKILPLSDPKNKLVRRIVLPIQGFVLIVRHNIQVIHFHDPEIIPVAILLRLIGRVVIYDIHEFYSEIFSANVRPGWRKKTVRWLSSLLVEKIPSKIFNRTVFPTTLLKEAITSSDSAVVLYNMPSDKIIEQATAETSSEKIYDIVFVGAVSPFRLKVFIEIFQRLADERPDLRVLFVGTAQKSIDWLTANVDSSFIERHLVFSKRVPLEEVIRLLQKSRLGFNYHPVDDERFRVAVPMKVYEYMLCGIPVVTSAFPELVGQFEDGENISLVGTADPDDYVKAISEILDDPERASSLGLAGREKVVETHNWRNSELPKLVEMYQQLTGQ